MHNKVVQWSQLRSAFFLVSLRSFYHKKMLHYAGPLTTALGSKKNRKHELQGSILGKKVY